MDLAHPLSGTVPQVGNPLKLSATPVAYTQAPPLLGEHTASVLRERLHLSDRALEELAVSRVIQMGPESEPSVP